MAAAVVFDANDVREQQPFSFQDAPPAKVDVSAENFSLEKVQVFLNFRYWTNWLHVLFYYGVQSIFCVQNEMGVSPVLRESYQFKYVSLQFKLNSLLSNNKISKLVIAEGPPDFTDNLIDALNSIRVFSRKETNVYFLMILNKRVRSCWRCYDRCFSDCLFS